MLTEIDHSLRRLGVDDVDLYQIHRLDPTTPMEETQDHYNLLAREEEREMLPLCAEAGVGTIVWSLLARDRIARPWGASTAPALPWTRSRTCATP